MEENSSYFELLFVKEIEGTLTESEEADLAEWLKTPQHRTVYEEQKKLWTSVGDLQKMKTIDPKKALKKVEARLFGRSSVYYLKKLERAAAVLFIPLLLSALWMLYKSDLSGNSINETVFNTIEVPPGTRSSFTLPDGTFVKLNAGSSLKYPVSFENQERQVELNGEAWFEVKKDPHHPFVVSTSDINIKVLGTSFNCSAYPNAGQIETALVEGKIEISGKSGKNKFLMEPGELAVFSKQEKTIEKAQTNLDKHIAWTSGKLMFRDDPMTTVIEKLGQWYRVEFQVEEPEILNYTYSATFSGESLDQVLKMLALSAPINFRFLPRERLNNLEYETQIIKLTKK
ncbi:FecR family protein [Gaoshiqia sediminis]|uniref:FecR domain-containing protein n=1 Tax=Gaoshiqia sediminis TaxID=2986998 RepID=A0AA41YAS1_9BACT|nr:FecR domain-containing protein [Gaoshiqia sediminis]MCW0484552.1 FecR domain-containing protein [Gaoshiqia sediminis]